MNKYFLYIKYILIYIPYQAMYEYTLLVALIIVIIIFFLYSRKSEKFDDRKFVKEITAPPTVDGDYTEFITKINIDSKTMSDHNKWAKEITPFNKLSKLVTEAPDLEQSIPFLGLQRPRRAPVHFPNKMQVTSIDNDDIRGSKLIQFN